MCPGEARGNHIEEVVLWLRSSVNMCLQGLRVKVRSSGRRNMGNSVGKQRDMSTVVHLNHSLVHLIHI